MKPNSNPMFRGRIFPIAALALGTFLLLTVQVEAQKPLTVYTVNYPLKYFAQRIGGDHVNAVLPVPPGIDPAFWSPDIRAISEFQQADLILLNGAGYAKWAAVASLPRAKTVNTSKGFKQHYIPLQGALTHTHGAGGEHAHEGFAFTTWLDLNLAAQQAGAILAGLNRKKPEAAQVFETNYLALVGDLEELDRSIRGLVAKKPATPLLASHPIYDYLSRGYGLNLESMHWEPDRMPPPAEWNALGEKLKHHAARWMLWEAKPEIEISDKLNSIGVGSVVFNPCGNVPAEGDFLSAMRDNMRALEQALQ